jgi:hypothetical protein
MSLPEQYRKLLSQYDEVLSLSRMILANLERGGTEENLSLLVERKEKVGNGIARLISEIALFEADGHSDSNFRTLAEVKPLLKQIEERANLLQGVEERIRSLLQKKGKR